MNIAPADIAARLDAIEAGQRAIETKMNRLLAAIYPDERQMEARACLDSLEGLSVDEIRARNRERNRRLKEQKANMRRQP